MTAMFASGLTRRAFTGLAGALAFLGMLSPVAAADHPPLQIWFIRHAESELNVIGTPKPVPDNGVSYPLTRNGMEQARALAAALKDVTIARLYSSTRLRALQTADAIAFTQNLPLTLAPEAVEIDFGLGLESNDSTRAAYQELARKWTVSKDAEARHGSGESFADVQRRFLPFVREIMNRHATDTGTVVVIAHGATLGFMVPMLANNVPSDFFLRHPLPNTAIIKTELRDSRLFCTEWAGIAGPQFGE